MFLAHFSVRALSIWITIDFTKAVFLHSLSIYDTSLDLLRWMDTPSIERRHDDTLRTTFLYKALLFSIDRPSGAQAFQGSGLDYLFEQYAISRGQIVNVMSHSGFPQKSSG
ncbi:hypothetical protein FPOAC2_01207 [Fusarium poae]|jgi:hypothetical protein